MGHKSASIGGWGKQIRTKDNVKHVERSPADSQPPNTPSFRENVILKFKEVVFPDFDDFGIQEMFTAIGWNHLMELKKFIYLELLREFYTNLKSTHRRGFVGQVKGVPITFSANTLDSLLKAPTDSPYVYNKKGWPTVTNFDRMECIARLTGQAPVWPSKSLSKDILLPVKILNHIIGYIQS